MSFTAIPAIRTSACAHVMNTLPFDQRSWKSNPALSPFHNLRPHVACRLADSLPGTDRSEATACMIVDCMNDYDCSMKHLVQGNLTRLTVDALLSDPLARGSDVI